MSGEGAAKVAPGTVVRYQPDDHGGDRFWCREGMALANREGILFDTYWISDRHRLTPTEVESATVVFNVHDCREVHGDHEWRSFRPEDRFVVTSQHRLQRRSYVRKDASPDLETRISNAFDEVEEAERTLTSAQHSLDGARRRLAHLVPALPATAPTEPTERTAP